MSPYSALSLVRHRIHALRQFMELLMKLTYLQHEGRLRSPYSALCLVQQRIHALRQSTAAWDFHGDSSVKVDSDPVVPLGGRFSPQLQLIDKVVAPSLMSCGMDFFKGPAHRCRAGGRVHRDTAPIIRCICRLGWRDTLVEHTVRTTTTTLRSHFGSSCRRGCRGGSLGR